ncbi:MAG: hypothetical protein KDK36_17150, partial [Leptospiraceae bacterium]|nr:hypothetical protein [Leptospiraceae bacterium]
DYPDNKFFESSRIAIHYNLLSILLAKLNLSEISLENTNLYIIEKNNQWNFTKIVNSKKEESKNQAYEEQEEEKKPLEEIYTFIPITAYLNFKIQNLNVFIKKENSPMDASLKNFGLKLKLDTHRENKIPLGITILNLPEVFELELIPNKEIGFSFLNENYEIEDKLGIYLNIIKKSTTEPIYSSNLNLNASSIKPKSKNRNPKELNLKLDYNLEYEKEKEELNLKNLDLEFQKNKWISITANLKGKLTESPVINLKTDKLELPLGELNSFLSSYPEFPKLNIGGYISGKKLEAKGNLTNLGVELILDGKNISFQSHSLPYLQITSNSFLNLKNSNHLDEKVKIPFVNEIFIPDCKLEYNKAKLDLKLDYNKDQNTDLNLNLQNFQIAQFTRVVGGALNANLTAKGEKLHHLNAILKLRWNYFKVKLGENYSIPSLLVGDLLANIELQKNFIPSNINIQKLNLNLYNRNGNSGVNALAIGSISSINPFIVKANTLNLDINFGNLMQSLPFNMLDTISSTRNTLGNTVSMKSSLSLDLTKGMNIIGNLKPIIPGLHLTDPEIKLDIGMNQDGNGSINIRNFSLKAFNSLLTGNLKGNLWKGRKSPSLGGFTPDLNFDLILNSPQMNKLNSSVFYKGKSGLNLKIKDSTASGKLFSENSNLSLFIGECPGALCKNYIITSLNINLPLEHDLNLKTTQSLIIADKSKYIKSYGNELPVNFTINRVTGTHPFFHNQPVIYVQETGNTPGFQGRFDYIKNVFTLDKLKINSLNGTIFGKDILFNLGGGDPTQMEFASTLQIREIDLKELLPPRRAKSIDDGKIAADLNLSGKNFKDLIPNLNLYFSIFKIGKDFGKSAINIVAPPNILRDVIVTSYSVDKIEVELSRGLVYADINFKGGILSYLFTKIEDNKISQERMPLANFLSRAQDEISIYR